MKLFAFYSGLNHSLRMRINNAFTMFWLGLRYSWTYRHGDFGMPSMLLNDTHEELVRKEIVQ